MNISGYLISPDGAALATANNSFVSNWMDKRSCPYVGLSVVFRGGATIGGSLVLEMSNIDERKGGAYGGPEQGISGTVGGNGLATPNNVTNPDDVVVLVGTTAVSATENFGTSAYQLLPAGPLGPRWLRVRYTATTSAAGITVSVYYSGAMSS